MEVVRVCTRLSRFVGLSPTDANNNELQETLTELSTFYESDTHHQQVLGSTSTETGTLSSATMDDIVLLTMQKLLLGYIIESNQRVQESAFTALSLVLRRTREKIQNNDQKLLGFVQSCVFYLPIPDAAVDPATSTPHRLQSSLQEQPEELRLQILRCLHLLFSCENLRTTELDLSATQQNHFFAYVISCMLHIGQNDRCHEAALLAMETLTLMLEFVHDAQTLRQFFPGVSVGVWKCVNASKQVSKVINAALHCLAVAMRLCIADATCSTTNTETRQAFSIEGLRAIQQQQQIDSEKEPTAQLPIKNENTMAHNNDKWLTETAVNLDIILSRIFGSQLHVKSWRVRSALVQVCGTLVLNCRVVMRESFFRCFEELVVFRVDPITEVAASANLVIQSLRSQLSTEEWITMLPNLADRFHMQLSTLVLQCATDHETTNRHRMRMLVGYLRFLEKRLESYLDNTMESIYTSLCRIVEFDAIDIDLIVHQEHDVAEPNDGDGGGFVVSQFQKRLRFFHEEESVNVAFELIQSIGAVCTPALYIDCAFTLMCSEAMEDRHAEILLVLNELLKAHVIPGGENAAKAPASGAVDVHLVGRILDDLLQLDEWNEHSERKKRAMKHLRSYANQRALMVECIGICAEILKDTFSPFLLHVLYPVVEKLGSHEVEIERAALTTLEKIYHFCGYTSMEALFEANMDYFVDALCSRLEHLEEYPLTCLAVEGLLRHMHVASLPLVDEVANSLLRSVDIYQDSPFINSLLRALQLLLNGISKDKPRPHRSNQYEHSSKSFPEEQPLTLLNQFIQEIQVLTNEQDSESVASNITKQPESTPVKEVESVKGAMPLEYDEMGAENGDNEDEENEADGPASAYRSFVVDLLDHSAYFLSDLDPIACCLVISIIEEGILFLQDSSKELLPLIHRLWPALLPRLTVENNAILIATIRLISTIAQVAGDFIADRFVDTVWPNLRSQLKKIELQKKMPQLTRSMLLISQPSTSESLADADKDDDNKPLQEEIERRGRKTQEVQLLLAIFTCLITVMSHSSAVTSLVPEMTTICGRFLSKNVPAEIVEKTREVFGALVKLNSDEVFCAVATLAEWTPPKPPSARFPALMLDATRTFYRGNSSEFWGESRLCRDNAAGMMEELFQQRV